MTRPNGCNARDKFGRALGATVLVFCRLCTNHSGYKLGHHKSRSTLYSSLICKIPRRSLKRFSMVQPHEMKMMIRLSDNSKVKVESVCVEEDLEGVGVEDVGKG